MSPDAPPPSTPPRRPGGGMPSVPLPYVLALVFVLVAVLVCLGLVLVARDLGSPVAMRPDPGPSAVVTTTAGPTAEVQRRAPQATADVTPVNVVEGATASADRTAPDNVDAEGRPVSYGAANLVDGDATTTWRAPGDARGAVLRIRFTAPRVVTALGLVNGYAKVDPASGADRYAEERRVLRVTWAFDDGTTYQQPLDDGYRALQRMEVDTTVRTSGVTLRIDAVTPPGDPERDYTAISEIEVLGV